MSHRAPAAGVALAALALILTVLVLASTTGVAPAAVASTPASSSVEKVAPKLTALHFRGPFVPLQVVAASGRVWVLGSRAPSSDTDCGLEEITPATMATRMYALPACATDIAAGGGRIYLVTGDMARGTNDYPLHIVAFDPHDGRSRVLSPVVMSVVGSAIAHTDFTYGGGALWLYAEQMLAGPEVVRISPATGAVTATLKPVPEIGGIDPAVAANGAGLWLAGGPGGPPGVAWVRPGTEVPATVFQGAVHSSVAWLSAVGDEVWAGVETYGTGPAPSGLTTLVELDQDGHLVVTSPSELTGQSPLVSTPGAGLWGLAAIGPCGHPAELLEVDPSTGSSHPSVALPSPAQACDDAGEGSQLAAVGRDVFALIPTGVAGSAVLYRAAT
jgi:hypothetical protein